MKKNIMLFIMCFAFSVLACGGDDYLSVEVVDDLQIPGTDGGGATHELFNNTPGSLVPLSSFTGVVDPVGTNLAADFDGDGIENDDETSSNAWVADYPVIETNISTPVTMKIEILETGSSKSKSYSSEITSSDVNSTSDLSTEAVHRNEIDLRTVQFQDSFNTANESTYEKTTSRSSGGGASIAGFGGSRSRTTSSTVSRANKEAYGETKTKWADIPFKNNTNKKGWALKRDEAEKMARALRNDVRTEFDQGYEIKANAGYVRAALYIDNLTVNMPVRLRNILCSFMLETPEGQLLPVQSFRLRSDDYSIFEIELYGGSTFGPYVIELKGLNTNEIKDAIARGYNPKIFIVDYEMVHVEDSNYRLALGGNYTGDNLKIIEENAKGRTAGIKFVAPGIREFFRVVAFNTDGDESRTGSTGATFVSPGLPLEKALERIGYSGKSIEFANYVLDFTGFNPPLNIVGPQGQQYGPRFNVRGIKRVNNIHTKMPCSKEIDETDGSTTYIMKPITEWTPEELSDFKLWVVFAKGKYYLHAGDLLDEHGHIQEYKYIDANGVEQTVPMVEGVRSIIWPGDHYDITYLNMSEYYGMIQDYGKNPLETYSVVPFSTRWNGGSFGEYPFYPDQNSVYLGVAAPGDTIEVKIKLKDTHYLNPAFGMPYDATGTKVYGDFFYNWKKSQKKFKLEEAVDFEISYGLEGKQSDWMHILDPNGKSPYSAYNGKIHLEDYSWDFMEQEFVLKLRIDDDIKGVDSDRGVKLYMRPCANNVYRESIWPLSYTEVKKFRGVLASETAKGGSVISVDYPAVILDSEGKPEITGDIFICSAEGTAKYTVDSHAANAEKTRYDITLTVPLNENHLRGEQVYIELNEAERPAKQRLKLAVDNSFVTKWNAEYEVTPPSQPKTMDGYIQLLTGDDPLNPARYLGLDTDYEIENWIGANNYNNPLWNNWNDGYLFNSILERALNPIIKANDGDYQGIRLIASGLDLPNNYKIAYSGGGQPQVVSFGDRALVVWGNYGIVYDISGDTPGPVNGMQQFLISNGGSPRVAVWENRALSVWDNGDGLRGRVIDINGDNPGPVVGVDDFLIGVGSSANVYTSNGHAFIVWTVYVMDPQTNTNHYEIRGTICNITGETPGVIPGFQDFQICTIPTGANNPCPHVAVSDGKAFVVWNSGSSVRGRMYNISGDNPGPVNGMSEIIIENNNGYTPQVAMSGSRALVTWNEVEVTTWSYRIMGRIYEISENEPTPLNGMGDFFINSQYEQSISNPRVAIWGNRALVVWRHGGLRGRFCDLSGSNSVSVIGNSDFLVTSSVLESYHNHKLFVSNGLIFVIWHAQSDIRGIVYDLSGEEPGALNGMQDIVINTRNVGCSFPDITLSNNRAFAVWNSDPLDGRIFEFYPNSEQIGLELPFGKNNFMVMPLVERFYDVQVKIVE